MPTDRNREETLFAAALNLPAAERAGFLERECAGDLALRQRVESLLAAHAEAGSFIDQPAGGQETIPLNTQTMLAPSERGGERIGRYKLLEKIGEGGFGDVWMAEQEEPVRRRVALKIIKLGMDTREVIARFEAERQALALMEHPNIARVFDGGATDRPLTPALSPGGGEGARRAGEGVSTLPAGRPYFVMELVRGVPITRYCDECRLTTRERLELFAQVCQAVQHAHQKGVIHRDLKPSNILVTELDGRAVPKVIDFGVARATEHRLTEKTLFTRFGQMIGTPAYMSPEQAGLGGLDIDTRSDVYSLGVVLYELLTGRTPFDPKKLLEAGYEAILKTIREVEPPKPSTKLSTLSPEELSATAQQRRAEPQKLNRLIRGELDWIVMKCLEKDRNRRYETSNDLASDIQRYLSNEPVVARPPSNVYLFQKLVRRNKVAVAGATAVAAALVIGLGISTWQFIEKNKAHQRTLAAEGEQRRLRQEAERAVVEEAEQRNRAEVNEKNANAALIQMRIQRAEDLFRADDSPMALAYLASVLRHNPSNDVAGQRLLAALVQRQYAILARGFGFTNAPRFRGQAQLTPDGQRVLINRGDAVSFFETTGEQGELYTISWPQRQGRQLVIESFRLSPDCRKLLLTRIGEGGAGEARVFDALTGEPFPGLFQHQSRITCIAFSPSSDKVATGSEDKTARIWDVQSGMPLTVPLSHGGEPRRSLDSVSFSPDGRKLLTTAWDGLLRVWEVATGQLAFDPIRVRNSVQGGFPADFNPAGTKIVTGSGWRDDRYYDDQSAHLWDAQTGRALGPTLKHGAHLHFTHFSPDGEKVVTGGEKGLRIWDANTGQLVQEMLRDERVWSAAFTADGLRLLVTRADQARLWNPQSGASLSEPFRAYGGILRPSFSSDGRLLLLPSSSGSILWEVPPPRLLPKRIETARLFRGRFSPSGRKLATTRDGGVRVWECQTAKLLVGPLRYSGAEFSPDDKKLLTMHETEARIWDSQTGQPLTAPFNHLNPEFVSRITCAAFSPDGTRVLTGSDDGTVRIWDAATGKPLTGPMEHLTTFDSKQMPLLSGGAKRVRFGAVNSAQFSPDGARIITTWEWGARVWDARTGKQLVELVNRYWIVKYGEFSPDGGLIATTGTGTEDGVGVEVWNAGSGERINEFRIAGEDPYFDSRVRFSPDGKRVAIAAGRSAQVWDPRSGQPVTERLRHDSWIASLAFSADSRRLVTASVDKTARIWDVETGQPLSESFRHSAVVISAQFSPDNKWLLTMTEMGAYIWEVPIPSTTASDVLIQWAECIAGQRLTNKGRLESINEQEIAALHARLFANSASRIDIPWLDWFFASASTRTISPGSSDSVEANVRELIEQNTLQSLAEAEPLAALNPELLQQVSQARRLLEQRTQAEAHARRGRWKEAATVLAQVVELNPDDHEVWHWLATILSQPGQFDSYREHCRKSVERFGKTKDPATAERIAKDGLILPASGVDLETVGKMTDTALSSGPNHPAITWFQFAKGLAEYRQDRFVSAVEWMQKVLTRAGDDPNRDVEAYMVLAMAQHQLKRPDEARSALAKGIEIAETKLPKLDSGDLGGGWIDWIIAHALLREAKAMIEGKSPVSGDQLKQK